MGEIFPPGVQVHLALSVKQDLDRPPAETASGLPQLQLSQLGVVDEFDELVGQSFHAMWVLVNEEDELEPPRLLRRR